MTKEQTGRRWELLAAVGAAWWIEKLFTVEWSYPYCSVMDNGEAAAVFGFPLPYQQASIVTSASAFFIPWLYVADLAAIAGGVLLLLRPLASRLGASNPRRRKLIVGAAGALLLVTAVSFEVFGISIGVWRPTSSFWGAPRYSELRPVALRVLEHPRDCTASPFWFGPRPPKYQQKVSYETSVGWFINDRVKKTSETHSRRSLSIPAAEHLLLTSKALSE